MSALCKFETERLKEIYTNFCSKRHEMHSEFMVNQMDPFNMNAHTAEFIKYEMDALYQTIERIGRELDNRARYGRKV